jgi:hypothetical protein
VTLTWLPIEPVVAEMLVIAGAGLVVELTDTPSKVTVASVPLKVLLTSRPMYTFWVMLTVTLGPDCTQFTPSGDA